MYFLILTVSKLSSHTVNFSIYSTLNPIYSTVTDNFIRYNLLGLGGNLTEHQNHSLVFGHLTSCTCCRFAANSMSFSRN